jgi:hypothetical protein
MLEHGGRLRQAAQRYGIPLADWVDLSTGINPQAYPVPPLAPEVWQRLPETDDGLEAAAAAYYGSTHLLPVAGSQAAIQALPACFASGRVITLAPTYAEHPHAWRGHALTAVPAQKSLPPWARPTPCSSSSPTTRTVSAFRANSCSPGTPIWRPAAAADRRRSLSSTPNPATAWCPSPASRAWWCCVRWASSSASPGRGSALCLPSPPC